ncbi:MAG TPA: hypothetical protein VFQ77_01505 [Pseudonocardiaceae bacterium]|nr:hypothetical protein [Pseudonocardiaceae bacterium]
MQRRIIIAEESMYIWIWRHLPGSRAVRSVEALLLLIAVLALLLFVVFPWIEPRLPFNDVTTN